MSDVEGAVRPQDLRNRNWNRNRRKEQGISPSSGAQVRMAEKLTSFQHENATGMPTNRIARLPAMKHGLPSPTGESNEFPDKESNPSSRENDTFNVESGQPAGPQYTVPSAVSISGTASYASSSEGHKCQCVGCLRRPAFPDPKCRIQSPKMSDLVHQQKKAGFRASPDVSAPFPQGCDPCKCACLCLESNRGPCAH
jgi:hypothetical protein